MSDKCQMIQNFSEKVSKSHDKCLEFARTEKMLGNLSMKDLNECVNIWCPKSVGPTVRMQNTNLQVGRVDLSAGVF